MSDLFDSKKIAVVGVEGAGKTVLLTTWATRQNNPTNGEMLFVPKNSHVLKYINRNWGKLQSGKWPDSTPQSEWQLLEWILQTPAGYKTTLNTVDMAGHDVRRVFFSSLDDLDEDDLDEASQNVRETIIAAEIILIVINIKNTAALGFEKRTDDEAVLLNIFQHAAKNNKTIAFVFTQWSDCEAWVNSRGGVQKMLHNLMPNLYSTIILYGVDNCNFLEVSAVVETETKMGDNGDFYQVPSYGFSSQGIDKLNNLISNIIEAEVTEVIAAEKEKTRKRESLRYWIFGFFLIFYILMVVGGQLAKKKLSNSPISCLAYLFGYVYNFYTFFQIVYLYKDLIGFAPRTFDKIDWTRYVSWGILGIIIIILCWLC